MSRRFSGVIVFPKGGGEMILYLLEDKKNLNETSKNKVFHSSEYFKFVFPPIQQKKYIFV